MRLKLRSISLSLTSLKSNSLKWMRFWSISWILQVRGQQAWGWQFWGWKIWGRQVWGLWVWGWNGGSRQVWGWQLWGWKVDKYEFDQIDVDKFVVDDFSSSCDGATKILEAWLRAIIFFYKSNYLLLRESFISHINIARAQKKRFGILRRFDQSFWIKLRLPWVM